VVQEARQLDVNIVSQIDVLAVKDLGELSRGFERRQLQRLTDKARAAFSTISGKKQSWTWVHSDATGFEGLLKNELPSFWTSRLSRAFAESGSGDGTSPPRRGRKSSTDEKRLKAQEMRAAGFSIRDIAKALAVCRRFEIFEITVGPDGVFLAHEVCASNPKR
jgi:hypothetical protein